VPSHFRDGTLVPAATLSVTALEGIPEVTPGDDLAALIAIALTSDPTRPRPLSDGDVLVVAHKVISKAEGRIRDLADVDPGPRALQLADTLGKDPRHVQVVLEESREVLRASHGVLICVTRHGFVCANAGVDASNVPGDEAVVMLPLDPDASARNLRARLQAVVNAKPAILITDSFGRAWRHGQVDVAIGCAGLAPLEDWRGRTDAVGRGLKATWIAVADELAGAADLARTKDGALPVIVVRGADRHVRADDGPGAAAMIRPESQDLFR
jgi:coenzyme F420-0:L-glutamate ligase/coenzyme F420-1:gamma-L-glutamate ligase